MAEIMFVFQLCLMILEYDSLVVIHQYYASMTRLVITTTFIQYSIDKCLLLHIERFHHKCLIYYELELERLK